MRTSSWCLSLFAVIALCLGAWWYVCAMPGQTYRGPLLPLTEAEVILQDRLHVHVQVLAGQIGERHLWRPEALQATVRYLTETLHSLGSAVVLHQVQVGEHRLTNVVMEQAGATHPQEMLILGAHYDTVRGSPGANDNASGVAALLEIARLLRGHTFARTVRYVAFVNEEPPFFQTANMGSWVYAQQARQREERIVGMWSLETLGFYSDAPQSQRYPFPFALLYPAQGNFVAFVGNLASRALVRQSIGAFRKHTAFPSEGVAAPASIPGIGWSDHWAFWQAGYPAVMITDTAPFRYAAYHTGSDTPAQLDYARLARVVAGLARMVAEHAGVMSAS
ncbi:MAG: M28 family peptidase [Candidatus Tectomicrobia bacterium]|uniref:M28 family peptidase n=1 Tax=Tectimicrobiota bacterium TaxID=2528274 RepID=A0A937W250_UNCTE|nr:M28 family peptidase [Candidatus Tectomicrobia bacterium]